MIFLVEELVIGRNVYVFRERAHTSLDPRIQMKRKKNCLIRKPFFFLTSG